MPGSFTSGMCWKNHIEMLSAHTTDSTMPIRCHPLRRNPRIGGRVARLLKWRQPPASVHGGPSSLCLAQSDPIGEDGSDQYLPAVVVRSP
jgi:hypothetical protein